MFLRKKRHTTDNTKNTESINKMAIKRTNLYIVIASFVCLTLFATAILIGKKKKNIATEENTTSPTLKDKENKVGEKIVAKVLPDIDISPLNIEFNEVIINSSSELTINITIKDAPAIISKISIDVNTTSIKIVDSCIERKRMDIGEQCTITITYSPVEMENKSLNLSVTWHGVDSNDGEEERNKNISLSISSKSEDTVNETNNNEVTEDPVKPETPAIPETEVKQTTENTENKVAEEKVGENNNITDEAEQDEEAEKIEDNEENKSKSTDDDFDCRKYAAKGRKRNGDFLGWIQTNKKVMSPDCKNVIGTLQDNGKIVKVGTQEIIGTGPRLDGKTDIMDDRILQEIPDGLKNPVFDTSDVEDMKVSYNAAMEKRKAVKEGTDKTPKVDQIESARKGEEGVDPYRASDPLGVMKIGKNELIPPSITTGEQVSSFPKKNKYTLRENKAIPAVINRAVKFFGDRGGGGEGTDTTQTSDNCGGSGVRVSATVERNVYSDTGRTIVMPSGTVVYGCVEPLTDSDKTKMYERVKMTWDRFIRPDGAEFNLGSGVATFSGDAQGQDGVPGKRDLGYMKRVLLEPILYSLLPIAVNMISPSTQTIKNTYSEAAGAFGGVESNNYKKIETSGELSSKEQAKAEIIENWRTVSQEIMGNSLKNFQPPFTIPAGTRITIFVQKDLILRLTETKGEMTGQEGEN